MGIMEGVQPIYRIVHADGVQKVLGIFLEESGANDRFQARLHPKYRRCLFVGNILPASVRGGMLRLIVGQTLVVFCWQSKCLALSMKAGTEASEQWYMCGDRWGSPS